MCCTNTTPHSRTSIQSRFIQQYEPRCFAGGRHSQRRLRARATRVLGTCGPTAALECLLAPRPSQAWAPARCRSHHPFVPTKAGTPGNSLRHLDSRLRGNERRRAARRKKAPAVGDLMAGVLSRRSSCRGHEGEPRLANANAPPTTIAGLNFAAVTFLQRRSASAAQGRRGPIGPHLTASGGACARNDSSDAPGLRLAAAAAKTARPAREWRVPLSARRSAATHCSQKGRL